MALLADAAEHIGNWVAEVPPWYDYSRDTFIGYRIGTRCVTNGESEAFELAEHFRFLHIALAASPGDRGGALPGVGPAPRPQAGRAAAFGIGSDAAALDPRRQGTRRSRG